MSGVVVIGCLCALVALGVREARRRSRLNRALHELRRPLQAVLLQPQPAGDYVALALNALNELDREINGSQHWNSEPVGRRAAPGRDLIAAAVARWRQRSAALGGTLEMRWRTQDAFVLRDPDQVSRAIDNLIANAIEHGGPEIVVDASRSARNLRIAVVDRGEGQARMAPRAGESIRSRLTGRRVHGHGLAVVRQIAAAQGGRFIFGTSTEGTRAVLELPLAEVGDAVVA